MNGKTYTFQAQNDTLVFDGDVKADLQVLVDKNLATVEVVEK